MCGTPHAHGNEGAQSNHLHAGDPRLYFDRDIIPVQEVAPGEIVVVDTLDCTGGLIKSEADLIESLDDLIAQLGGLNYVTGPIAVKGVRAGDILRVTVLDIDPAPDTHRGFIAVVPGFGSLVYDNGRGLEARIAPSTTICTVTRDEVTLPFKTGAVRLPSRPFIGTIGVAPTYERRMTLSQSPDYLGDLDIPDLCTGSTIHIRANHDGGLLSLGDVHAAQGDGEVAGVAVEISARVTLRIDVTPRGESQLRRLPLLVDGERVGVVAAYQGLPTSLCVRSAAVELCELLTRLGMSTGDAIQYLSAAARVRIGNMFEPFYSSYVFVDRTTLPVRLPDELLPAS
ncbi:MAG: acetamidase/formamidase family protein [Candidatus Dormibacteraeota bacterium]|nr:acetamidase/formamidase family protein [Candidatus Dormibacteraeota bacterium]